MRPRPANIFRADRLDPAATAALFQLRGSPDWPEARERLILSNAGLAGRMADRAWRPGREWEELFAAGLVGLVEAVDTFDPCHPSGAGFCTHAVWQIRRTIESHGIRPLRRGHCRGGGPDVLPLPEHLPAPEAREGVDAEELEAIMGRIGPDGREALALRFGLDGGGPRSFGAMAREMGVSDVWAEHLYRRSLATLREAMA